MTLSAQTIRRLCLTTVKPLITPFVERGVSPQGLSFGLSSCGYDIRLLDSLCLDRGDFKLASTVERFCLPDNLMMRIVDKSTWARRGVFVQNTVAEPGWEGFLTLELTYHGSSPRWIDPGTPIAQVIFEYLDEPTEQPYRGKYQNQEAGPQAARVEKMR